MMHATRLGKLTYHSGHPSTTLAILNQNQIAYLDATGSGCETISHIYENGRVTVMLCSFGASPRILRLFCRGRVIEKGDRQFKMWVERMIDSGMEMDKELLRGKESDDASHDSGDEESRPLTMDMKGIRAVIVLDVFKVQTSCGFGVPVFPHSKESSEANTVEATSFTDLPTNNDGMNEQKGASAWKPWDDRPTMPSWAGKMAAKDGALEKYRENNNWRSLDGCPGLKAARRDRRQWLVVEQTKARALRMVRQWDAFLLGVLLVMMVFGVAVHFDIMKLNV